MTETPIATVPYAALRDVVCVLDGLTRAFDRVADYGREGHYASAREDATTLRELRARLLPGRSNDSAWGEETYGAAREWYNEIAHAFTYGVPEADGKPLPG